MSKSSPSFSAFHTLPVHSDPSPLTFPPPCPPFLFPPLPTSSRPSSPPPYFQPFPFPSLPPLITPEVWGALYIAHPAGPRGARPPNAFSCNSQPEICKSVKYIFLNCPELGARGLCSPCHCPRGWLLLLRSRKATTASAGVFVSEAVWKSSGRQTPEDRCVDVHTYS